MAVALKRLSSLVRLACDGSLVRLACDGSRVRLAGRVALLSSMLAVLAAPAIAHADVSLEIEATRGSAPLLFASGMVLQRDTNAPIWGKAEPGESVSVTISGQTKTTSAAGNGTWRVELDPMPAGGPYDMTIEGNNTITLTDVLVGDVWVCAGQSNMVIRRPHQSELDEFPEIHTMGRGGEWTERPSAMAFAFAREMYAELGVPIGLINRAAGGTSIKNWLSPSAASDPDPDLQAVVGTWDDWGDAYERHIQPFAGFAIKGILYWQGEQDLKLARQQPGSVRNYYHLLPGLVRSWRADWQRGDIPFVAVQLPTGGGLEAGQTPSGRPPVPTDPAIAVIMRQSTFNVLSEPATGLMVSVDIPGAVHPKDHDLYGYRLANAALGAAYSATFAYSGPIFSSAQLEAGGRIRISFREHTADGLHAEGGPLDGFAISADGEQFEWAQAEIQGNEVVVWHDDIPDPTVVHYAWDHFPTYANLFNDTGLGTAPFSTTETVAP